MSTSIDLFSGYDSFEGKVHPAAVSLAKGSQIRLRGTSLGSDIEVCTTTEQFLKTLQVDQSAKVSYVGASGSEKMSFLQEISMTDTTVVVLAKVQYVHGTSYFQNAIIRTDLNITGISPIEFTKRFGDQFVDSLTLGAIYVIAFVFHCNDTSTHTAVSADLSGEGGGPLSMSASLSIKLDQVSKTHQLSYSIHQKQIGAAISGQPVSDSVDAILKFVQVFSDKITHEPQGGYDIIEFSLSGYELIKGAPDMDNVVRNRIIINGPDTNETHRALGYQILMISEILNKIKYIEQTYKFYGSTIHDVDLEKFKKIVTNDQSRIEDLIKNIFHNRFISHNSLSAECIQHERPSIKFAVITYGDFGGPGGDIFTDVTRDNILNHQRIKKIQSSVDIIIRMLKVTYEIGNMERTFTHGVDGRPQAIFETGGERVTSIGISWGDRDRAREFQLTFESGVTYESHGTRNDNFITIPVKAGDYFVGFNGRCGSYIDSLTPVVVRLDVCRWE